MKVTFSGALWFWKGPSPYHFISVPDECCGAIESTAAIVSYGWGMIPVTASIGRTEWKTALFPKDGGYVVPIKAAVQRSERLELGDTVEVTLAVDV